MMKQTWRIIILLAFAGILGACARNTNTVELPTLAVVPTLTPSITPSITPTPTFTRTPSPTATLTPSRTPTLTPSQTYTPSRTPTFTVTPTATDTPTPSDTPTLTPSETASVPSIISFEVLPAQTVRGGQVTLVWETDADQVLVEIMDSQTRTIDLLSLPSKGQQTLTVPRRIQNLAIFSMTASRGSHTTKLDVPVTLICGIDWFYDDKLLSSEGCPAANAITSMGRYQQFERGYMVYVPFSNRVYTYYGGQQQGVWVQHTPPAYTESDPIAPPTNRLYEVQNEFIGIWMDIEAPTERSWMAEIGFGTTPAVQSQVSYQEEEGTNFFYVGAGNGLLFQMKPNLQMPNTGTWNRIK